MAAGTIEANKEILQKIFSEDFWFLIPEYQRSYVWQTDNITELVDDLYFAFEHKPENDYFLGSLVLKKLKESTFPEYEVLDGQQRLTTFFIMMAVLRDTIDNPQYKKTLHKKIFQEESPLENIPSRTRLTYKIRDSVEDFIHQFVIKLEGTSNIDALKSYLESDNVSISNMSNAILVLREQMLKIKQEHGLEEFVKFIFNKALFIYVSTENTEDAFRLFTILNNRGIPLTNADILKSQNIGALPTEKEKNKYAKIWEEIEGKHGDDFDRFLQFIRTILVQEKARANLLEEFNEKIYSVKPPQTPRLQLGKDTIDFINRYNEIYEEIIELQSTTLSNSFKNLLTIMKIGLRSEDWIPPLMHYYAKFGTKQLEEFLKKLEYKFTGDWVCGITPTIRLDAMNSILKMIDQTPQSQLDNLLNNSQLFEIDLEEFKRNIQGNIYKKQYARHLLLKVEYLSGDNTVHLSNYEYITVEHVLPQNPPDNSQWTRDFNEEERTNWVNKIANLVLISQKKNSALSNQDFEQKKKTYLSKRIDAFHANKVFIEQNSKWTPSVLKDRQAQLINMLSEIQ
ncbi:DUF262 domain-containing protein [Brevibacillus composti]|uniref:DUF262 domain-containing protein n=1 Tax=Brevibacillus composti TaxID=2796470 RepID=A0A7T5ELX1_9BACL|nr:DUF262 domain-containing protein [Brevibacillus composti]QQE75003.1 DUF262 domain-containing protein [Brevibacillus composti]QUO42088.1 DUF262 domain-containing protein [Brevibacillus composti]